MMNLLAHVNRIDSPTQMHTSDAICRVGPWSHSIRRCNRDFRIEIKAQSRADGRDAGTSFSAGVGKWRGGIFGWVGSLLNGATLARRFGGSPGQNVDELLAEGLSQYGEDLVHHLRGTFGLVVYDHERQTVCWYRDRFGHIPAMYSHYEPQGLWIGSCLFRPTGTTRHSLRPNSARLANYLLYEFADSSDQDFFDGVWRLKPAHVFQVRLQNDIQTTSDRYWEPETVHTTAVGDRCWLRRVRERVDTSMRAHVAAANRAVLTLSSGLDSGLLASSLKLMKRGDACAPAATMAFPDFPDTDESDLVKSLADELGIAVRLFNMQDVQPVRTLLQVQEFWGYGPTFHPGESYETTFVERIRDHYAADVVLGGHGGELVIRESSGSHVESAFEQTFGEFGKAVSSLLLDGRKLLRERVVPRQMRALLALRRRTSQVFGDHLLDKRFLNQHTLRLAVSICRPSSRSFETWGWELGRRMGWRQQLRTGVVQQYPYLTPSLVKLGQQAPPTLQPNGSYRSNRFLMSRVAAGRLPERIRSLPKHGLFNAYVVHALNEEREKVRAVLNAGAKLFEARQLLDTSALHSFVEFYLDSLAKRGDRKGNSLPGPLCVWIPLSVAAWNRN